MTEDQYNNLFNQNLIIVLLCLLNMIILLAK